MEWLSLAVGGAGACGRPAGASPAALPPYFTLRVPGFGVSAKVKRVWVAMPAQGSMWCGGIIERQPAAVSAWNKFVHNAPAGGASITEILAIH